MIVVRDEEAPVLLDVPMDITIQAGENVPSPANVTATDDCDNNVAIEFAETTTDDACGSSITRTWTATDACGHTNVATQVITIEGGLTVSAVTTPDNCEQGNGTAILTPADLSYTWSDGTTTSSRTDLAAGTYTVTATNNSGCETVANVVVEAECDCIEPEVTDVQITDATCTTGGSAVIIVEGNPADYVYVWTPDVGTSNNLGNVRTDLPAGDYSISVRFMMAEDCEQKATFTVGLNGGLDVEIVEVVGEGCGELGAATLAPANLTYNWSDGEMGATRDDLLAGSYTVTATDGDCSQEIEVVIPAITCTEDIDSVQVTIPFETITEYCIDDDVLQLDGEITDITFCDSGTEATVEATDVDGACIIFEPADEYIGEGFVCVIHCSMDICDTTYIEIIVEEPGENLGIITETEALLNVDCAVGEAVYCINVPLADIGNYTVTDNGVPFNSFSGCNYQGTLAYSYMAMPDFGEVGPYQLRWSINGVNYNSTFNNLEELIDLMNEWDTAADWFLNHAEGSIGGANVNTNYGSLIVEQSTTGIIATIQLEQGVYPNSTRLSLDMGEHHLVFINNETGLMDELDIMVHCTTVDALTTQMEQTETDTLCLETVEMMGSNYTIENICSESSGEYVLFDVIPGTTCVTCYAMEEGTENACFVICDEMGICDTTYIEVTVRNGATITAPVAAVDTVHTAENTAVVIDILSNDVATEIDSLFINAQPSQGTVKVNLDNTLTYTPAADFCDAEPVVFSYVACNKGGCDETLVLVYVDCDAIQVYSGFSPNEDGINDYFRIGGLQNYPKHQLTVFNRWGAKVFEAKDYQNDWKGTFEGKNLPDGTYFYIIDTGEGEVMSGYLQINR